MKKVLLHICCAPCALEPVDLLRDDNMQVMGFFYRHNIHPFKECMRREEALQEYARQSNLKVIYQQDYDLEGFLRGISFRESDRCRFCYHERLRTTALLAKRGKFDAFSSTLLYSKFQKHSLIVQTGNALAHETGVPFLYRDFRDRWKQGISRSRQMGLYRQDYCGCVYSEKERFYRPPKKERTD